LLDNVAFVSALSLWALVAGHWASWQASRVEVEQQREEKKDTEGKMVSRLVKETTINRSKQRTSKK
jgi:hypothetical protein